MKLKKYRQFLNESVNFSSKNEILKYFDENRKEIISKNLDFNELRENLCKALDSLDDNFLNKIYNEIQSIDITNKEEFSHKFSEVIQSILEQIEGVKEGFMDFISSIWQKVKNAVHWITDRIWTISGILTMTLSGFLYFLSQYINTGLAKDFSFVAINAVLVLGFTLLKIGHKYDKINDVSDI